MIDVDRPGGYAAEDFWEPIRARADGRLILDPEEFYILASREKMQIPADLAAEMAPIDPAIGEFRVHYAGFFDPGFGLGSDGRPGAQAVLEVRSRDVPFLLEDGQPVGRLMYEELAGAADELYGADRRPRITRGRASSFPSIFAIFARPERARDACRPGRRWAKLSARCASASSGRSSMVERKLPKLHTRVRFPSPAPADPKS